MGAPIAGSALFMVYYQKIVTKPFIFRFVCELTSTMRMSIILET